MGNISFDETSAEDRRLALAVIENLEKAGVEGIKVRLERAADPTVVRSWVSLDRAVPVTTEIVERIFGPDEIKKFQERFGVTGEPVLQRLTQVLPRIIGRLTPLGKLPTDRALKFQFTELRRKLAR